MKNPLRLIVCALCALCFYAVLSTSCVTDDFDIDPPAVENIDPYAVSVDEALADMYSLMDVLYSPGTRAAGRKIASVETLKSSTLAPMTRCTMVAGPDLSNDLSDLVHIVNFENEEGYAIVGADKRVESVICITEAGNFTLEEIEQIAKELENRTDSGDPGEDEETLLYAEEEEFIEEILVSYIIEETERIKEDIASGSSEVDVYHPLDPDICGPGWIPVPEDNSGSNGNSNGGNQIPYDVWYTVPHSTIKPLLTTKWNQGNPYNMRCPGDVPAGCVAIALAQIVAHNEKPAPTTLWSVAKRSWKEIREYNYNAHSDRTLSLGNAGYLESGELASIIREIGDAVSTNYSSNGSSAYTYKARAFIDKYYSNVDRITLKYDEDAIIKMISHRRPVYIDSNQGHAWVIDGTMHQQRHRYRYYNGEPSSTIVDERTLVHCNFGWGGAADGYYARKAFNTTEGPVEREPGVDDPGAGSGPGNYTRSFNIITYE